MVAADPPAVRRDGDDLVVLCRVQPGASRSQVDGIRDGRLWLRVQAPPDEGRANAAVCALLAAACAVAPRAVVIEAGERQRLKRVRVRGVAVVPAGWAAPVPPVS